MSDADKYRTTMRYISLGTQWMVLLIVAVWLGLKVDEWIGWKFPVCLITFPLVALGVSLWQLVKAFNKPKK
ncbi:hypothetical protein [Polluticoccus soli]|uniref:hypothetical protein n=1 Tax=Polluticoccus soli TaxID=3034150 RepID=UPI0023E0FA24|nr:hypothetical protein [Flavipsychrobacter sp. JY13-12]